MRNAIEHADLILLLKHRMSQEGKYLNGLLRSLEHIAEDLHAEYVMHAKYMHDLCTLLMHIPTYYNVISCYNYVLWGFSIDPPYFGYNSA
jgi:hypothetical protein